MSDPVTPIPYDVFERDWKQRHRGSIPRKEKTSSTSEYFWIIFWVIVSIGAAVFSAAHTIPAAELTILADVPFRSQLAITAFVIVELVIFGAAAGRREINWLIWLLIASLLVALAGNTSSSVRAVAENGGDILNQFGGILLSIIAPFTALASGEVTHIQLDKRSAKQKAAQADYDERYRDMEAKINQAYTRYLNDLKPEKPAEISRNFVKLSEEPKPRVKIHEVAQRVRENGDQGLSVRDMMEKYGISEGSTSKVRELLKSQNGHSINGHGG